MCAEMRDNMAVEMTLPELEANIEAILFVMGEAV